jgi:hypothetical protein
MSLVVCKWVFFFSLVLLYITKRYETRLYLILSGRLKEQPMQNTNWSFMKTRKYFIQIYHGGVFTKNTSRETRNTRANPNDDA